MLLFLRNGSMKLSVWPNNGEGVTGNRPRALDKDTSEKNLRRIR